jgi:hypothetical protein
LEIIRLSVVTGLDRGSPLPSKSFILRGRDIGPAGCVLVQREVERARSPLASITPFSASRFGTTSPNAVAGGGTGRRRKLVSRKENTLDPRSHRPRGWKNKLAREENSDGSNAHTSHQATSVWPHSDMAVSRPRYCFRDGIRALLTNGHYAVKCTRIGGDGRRFHSARSR